MPLCPHHKNKTNKIVVMYTSASGSVNFSFIIIGLHNNSVLPEFIKVEFKEAYSNGITITQDV